MFTLLVLSRFDASGAGPRYRIYQYFDELRKLGIKIEEKPLLDSRYIHKLYSQKKRSFLYLAGKYLQRAFFLLFNKSKYDLAIMDGELFPYLPFFLERLFLPKKYMMDQDDAIFHNYDLNKLFLIRFLLSKKIDKVIKNSQHVIVGNSYVKDRASSAGAKNITVLPTVVDANKYKPSYNERSRDAVVIGWVGSPTTVKYLSLIEPVLVRIAQRKNIVLSVIGADYYIKGVKTICHSWPKDWCEAEEINCTDNIDIGIMPLTDSPWEKGKCGFKLIKYMACAKPMVASAVGMNFEIIDHGKNGYLASSLEEWENYLLQLIENKDLRDQLGKSGREKMLKEYSLQVTAPIICNILTQTNLSLRSLP